MPLCLAMCSIVRCDSAPFRTKSAKKKHDSAAFAEALLRAEFALGHCATVLKRERCRWLKALLLLRRRACMPQRDCAISGRIEPDELQRLTGKTATAAFDLASWLEAPLDALRINLLPLQCRVIDAVLLFAVLQIASEPEKRYKHTRATDWLLFQPRVCNKSSCAAGFAVLVI